MFILGFGLIIGMIALGAYLVYCSSSYCRSDRKSAKRQNSRRDNPWKISFSGSIPVRLI